MKIRLLLALFVLLPSLAQAWIDPLPFPQGNWQYRAPISVTNNGSALADYQVAVNTTNLVYNNTGLVGSWHFSESFGTALSDLSGNGNTGTYNGETFKTGTLTNFNFTASSGWAPGRFGTALKFDGANDYVAPSAEIAGDAAFTISAWAWLDSTKAGYGAIVTTRDGDVEYNPSTDTFDLNIWADRNGNYNSGTATRYYYSFAYPGIENQWVHLTYVAFSDNTAKFYINGTEVSIGSRATDGGVGSDYSTSIGANIPRNSEYFKGAVDEVRAYTRSLSASEIAQVYQNNTFIRNGLAAYWRFDEGAGTTAQDTHHIVTPDNKNGTKFGNALSFDGAVDYAVLSKTLETFGNPKGTLEFWFMPAMSYNSTDGRATSNPYLVGIGPADNCCYSGVWIKPSGTIEILHNDNTNNYFQSNRSSWSANTWYHFVYTWDADSDIRQIFINGVLDNSTSAPLGARTGQPEMALGGRYDSLDNNKKFNGTIDEVRIYNRALSASEIQALYSASKLRPDYADLRFSQTYTLYETPITISGTGTALTDYQVSMNITSPTALSHMNANGSDLRFFGAQTSTPYSQAGLLYWVESINSTLAKVWVKANVSAAGSTIYLYYGNPSASAVSNYFNTFDVLGDGSSGALTVSSANTIINTYTYLTGNESAGDSTIAVNNGTGFSNGDEILIIQMQNYSGGTAGTYEFRKISSGGGTTSLTLNAPLKNSYASGTFDSTTATVTQVVRVPQYTIVTINNGASITAAAWSGYSGGIVAFKANGTVTIVSGGTISATAKGFRTSPGCCVAIGFINGNGSEGYTGKGNYDQLATLGGGGAGKLCANSNTAGGGGGSYATAGTAGYIQGSCTAGAGSTTIFGSPDLKILLFGGAGGVGYAGPSSNGGGIIAILANNLNNSGTITAQGGDGGQVIAPSGAGAGGSISIIAGTLATGNNVIATAGASAIAGAGAGGNGRIRLSYNSITGTSNPVAYTTGFDTEHNRKYASPEPSATVGAESVKSTGNEALAPYWQESDSRAWVKVTGTPAGASTIYAYYGNPTAAGAGNATALNYFNYASDPSLSAAYTDFTDHPTNTHSLGSPPGSDPFVMEFDMALAAAVSATDFAFGLFYAGDSAPKSKIAFGPDYSNYWDEWTTDTSHVYHTANVVVAQGADTYHVTITKNSTNVNYKVKNSGGTTIIDSNLNIAGWNYYVDSVGLGTRHAGAVNSWDPGLQRLKGCDGAQCVTYDNTHVRKYAAPEPTLSLQQEELQSPALFIGVSPASKTTYPGYNETFSLWVYNNQTGSDTFTLSCGGACSVSPSSLLLTPYQNGSVTVTVTSANASGTTNYQITATSQANSSNSASVSVSITVDATKWRPTWSDAYNNGFRYRVPITVTNGGNATLTDYQVNVTVDTVSPITAGKMRSDCGDLRFTNGTNEMPYWIEGGCNTSVAKIWVRVPYVPAGSSVIYAYYGSPASANRSNGTATFIFFDDFNRPDGALGNGWTQYSGSTAVYSNFARLRTTSVDAWAYNPGSGDANNIVITEDVRILEASQGRAVSFVRASASGNWIQDGYGFYYGQGVIYIYDNGASKNSTAITMPVGTWYRMEMRIAPNNAVEVRLWQNGTARPASPTVSWYGAPASPGTNLKISGAGNYNTDNSDIDNYYIRRYASAEPSASAASEQARGYRVLVRRCGLRQTGANVTAYYPANATSAGSCLTNSTGICTLEISAGTYNLLLNYSDNSTAWKNGTVFG